LVGICNLCKSENQRNLKLCKYPLTMNILYENIKRWNRFNYRSKDMIMKVKSRAKPNGGSNYQLWQKDLLWTCLEM
jgi:hypothetical protein